MKRRRYSRISLPVCTWLGYVITTPGKGLAWELDEADWYPDCEHLASEHQEITVALTTGLWKLGLACCGRRKWRSIGVALLGGSALLE